MKDLQASVVNSVLEEKHCVGVFPTGYGKSLCFLLPPLILDLDCEDNFKHISIVISPLKSLMLDQCQQSSRHGISAAVIKIKEQMSSEVIEGN
jgi:ATP-dependent DNA helicase RecQ